MDKAYYFYPFIVLLIPVLVFYIKNITEMQFKYVLHIYGCLSLVLLSIYLFLLYTFQLPINISSGILFLIVLLFYKPWYKWARFASSYKHQHIFEFILFLLIYSFFVFYIGYPFVVFMFYTSLSILLLCIIKIYSDKGSLNSPPLENIMETLDINMQIQDKPDIYHIVLDGYTGFYGIKYINNFDISQFYNQLENMGFEMVKAAYSNYPHTSASLASMVNMEYTKGYLSEDDFNNKSFIADNQRYRFSFVLKSKVVYMLKNAGYKFFTTGEPLFSDFLLNQAGDIIDLNTSRAKKIITGSVYVNFFRMTALGKFFTVTQSMKDHVKYLKDIFNNTSNIYDNSPYYNFIHIWAPHAPYCFNKDGSINQVFADISDTYIDTEESRKAYLNHVSYINTLTLDTLTKLINNIKNKGRKALVLLHSDHGVFVTKSKSSEYNVLLGLYQFGYDDNRKLFSEPVSLINVFILLFNKYFNSNINLKEDKFFYENCTIPSYNEQDITEQVKKDIKHDIDR